MNSAQQVLTNGEFDSEDAAWAHFDDIVERCGLFNSYSEVEGWMLHPRPDTDAKGVRIDRLLSPRKALQDAGWCDGMIGVEGKKSGHPIGRVISQALDYSRSVFELKPGGFLVMVRWVFLWPLDAEEKGDLGSVMAQNRIGWVRSSTRTPLVFGCSGTHGITVNHDGTCAVKHLPMGRKCGSR